MTRYATRDCDCPAVETGVGQKRPEPCEHGNRYLTDAQRNPKPQRSTTSRQPDRHWDDALAKVAEEGCCRICKRTDRKLEAAHVLGREHDEPMVSRSTGEILKTLYVHPDRIFVLCGPFPNGCHGDAEHRRINVLPYLTLDEQLQAVRDAGGIAPAAMRLAPVEHREEVEASSADAIAGSVS